MDHYLKTLGEELPSRLHGVLTWDFIPWDSVRKRHGDLPHTSLIALLEAYSRLAEIMDIDSLVSSPIPSDSGGCLRCGSCCTYLRPGAVSRRTYQAWRRKNLPVAMFYGPIGRGSPPSSYSSWFNNGVRLRMCPFMLINSLDSRPFCCIHHMGREHRPRACSRFPPNPPLCQTGNFVPVP